jgi:hypothetical protein
VLLIDRLADGWADLGVMVTTSGIETEQTNESTVFAVVLLLEEESGIGRSGSRKTNEDVGDLVSTWLVAGVRGDDSGSISDFASEEESESKLTAAL